MSEKLERELYLPLYKGANLEGWALYRIADGSWGKKPFDIGGCAPNGEAVALEVKVIERPFDLSKPLPWRKFSDHQLQWLEFFAARPCSFSLVGLFIESTAEMRIYEITAPEFLNEPARLFSCVNLEKDTKGNFKGWKEIIREHDRRSLTRVLENI